MRVFLAYVLSDRRRKVQLSECCHTEQSRVQAETSRISSVAELTTKTAKKNIVEALLDIPQEDTQHDMCIMPHKLQNDLEQDITSDSECESDSRDSPGPSTGVAFLHPSTAPYCSLDARPAAKGNMELRRTRNAQNIPHGSAVPMVSRALVRIPSLSTVTTGLRTWEEDESEHPSLQFASFRPGGPAATGIHASVKDARGRHERSVVAEPLRKHLGRSLGISACA